MRGKDYLDKKYGEVRGNGNGMSAILEDYLEESIKNALKRLPKHKIQIKADPAIDGLGDADIEVVEVSWLLKLLNIKDGE